MTKKLYITIDKFILPLAYSGLDVLHTSDFHPCNPFFANHNNVHPYDYDEIIVIGALNECIYTRYMLRIIDWLLKKGGICKIYHFDYKYFGINKYFLKIAFSYVNGERYFLIKEQNDILPHLTAFTYKKHSIRNYDDISEWSFGIISGGNNDEKLLSILASIEKQQIPHYEVLICGPKPSFELPEFVSFLDDSSFYGEDIRIPISKKKNCIFSHAKYNNLVVIHDRIRLSDNWYAKMVEHGPCFDFLCNKIVDKDYNQHRIYDWLDFSHKLLPYNIWTENIYVSGGAYILKKDLVSTILLNPNLMWNEGEDTDFSRRCYLHGVVTTLDSNNYFISVGHRLASKEKMVSRVSVWSLKYKRTIKKILRYKSTIEIIERTLELIKW
ncbi:hypothetical protein [Prevotella sp.]|uniref:hypothetical protein n=1 Tax=Prevotella sp. TaxID=59823 RepID=UPI0026494CFD|nr:hypothetical protein [Prevotella sp.]MDN5554334.1 hypothetical protein [Prevotella sp.]